MRSSLTARFTLALTLLGAALAAPSHASINPVAVPEPSSYALLALGLVPLAFVIRKHLLSRNSA